MTTQQIEYFLQLSDELHYWRTSYKVNITQSVLSRQIKALEDELQVQLFKRSNRKVELTPAGKFLQQQWQPLIEQMNAAALYARKIHQGEGGSKPVPLYLHWRKDEEHAMIRNVLHLIA